MNRQFVAKMVQAKRLEYEALKEIMPEPLVKGIQKIENELLEVGKEIVKSVVFDTKKGSNENCYKENGSDVKSKARKVTIE